MISPHGLQPFDDLAGWRAQFPIFDRSLYLNTCSLGALSRSSRTAVYNFLDLWEELGASAWYKFWLDEVQNYRVRVATLINAAPQEIAVMPNVSSALSVIASALEVAPAWDGAPGQRRNQVVATEMDFPTISYQWLAKAGQDVHVELLPSERRISVPTTAFAEAIGDRTILVATSHVFFTSGYVQDIKTLADLAHRQGAYCLIDGYQGAGQVLVDVKAAGVDFYISGGLKWLLGGPGVAFLYVRPELIPRLEPTIAGWFGHAHMFGFDPAHFAFHETARRFEMGTPAVAAIYAARAGLDIILEIGMARIRQRTLYLACDLAERARAAGFSVEVPEDVAERSGIIMIAMPDPPAVVAELARRKIIVDSRSGRLRISPFFYNTLEDNLAVMEALQEIVPPGLGREMTR